MRAATAERILTPTFLLTTAIQHLYFAAFYSTFTALPLYVEDFPEWQIGLVIGAGGISAFLLGPFAGRLADRRGRRGTMLFGAVTTAGCFGLYGLVQSLWPLLLLRLVHGGVMQFFATANSAIVADIAPAARRAEAMGVANVVNTAAQIYAPWAGLFIATNVGFEWYWGGTTAIVFACVALTAAVRDEYVPAHRDQPLISRSGLLPFAVFTGFTTGFGALTAFLTPYGEEGLGDAGLWFTLFGVTMLFVRISAGRLADRRGRVAVIMPGGIVMCAGFVLLGSLQQPWAFYASAMLIGAGFGSAHTSLVALAVDRAGPDERAGALAVFFLAWGAGQTIGAIGLSPLAGAVGFGPVFVVAGIAALSGLPLLLRAGRRVGTLARPSLATHN